MIVRVTKLLYSKLKAENHWYDIYYLYYKEKSRITELAHNFFLFYLLPKLLLTLDASFDCCGWKNLFALVFFAHNGNVYIAEPRIINEFHLKFVIKQTFATLLANLALEIIISTTKATIRVEK